jgi:hypothetical protein
LDAKTLWELRCDFCGSKLLNAEQERAHVQMTPLHMKRQTLGARSAKLALGLLGAASLSLSACEQSSTSASDAGETAGVQMITAGDDNAYAEYGTFPAGELGGEPVAGVDMIIAGDDNAYAEYGTFPAGELGGEPAGETAGVDMVIAGDDNAYAEYGTFPAGELAGESAGEMAGEAAGEMAGEAAGEMAGEAAGVEMMPAGDDQFAPEYGAPPAGEEG